MNMDMRAGWNGFEGRIWLRGRSLEAPDLAKALNCVYKSNSINKILP